jgi:hypothetical protein
LALASNLLATPSVLALTSRVVLVACALGCTPSEPCDYDCDVPRPAIRVRWRFASGDSCYDRRADEVTVTIESERGRISASEESLSCGSYGMVIAIRDPDRKQDLSVTAWNDDGVVSSYKTEFFVADRETLYDLTIYLP